MEEFALSWAADAMRARVLGDASGTVTKVVTDSREGEPGALFFALKGENSDGHSFVPDAIARGAAAVVATPIEPGEGKGAQLVVDDPLIAMGELARTYRGQFSIDVVGITGSVGKTSTKEMTAQVLRTGFSVLANEKNYNNEIGVPKTLFHLNRSHNVAVVEMGMRAAGEIRALANIARPNIAVITNVGFAHIELLGSRQAIAGAKAEILESLPEGEIAILPDSLPYPEMFRDRVPSGTRVIRVGGEDADIWAEPVERGQLKAGRSSIRVHVRKTGESAEINFQTPGSHHRSNALLAIAVGTALSIPLQQAAMALEAWRGAEGRMTMRAGLRGVTILDDCYNAGPESMQAALEALSEYQIGRVAVLGDMRELGAAAADLHRLVGGYAAISGLRLLVTVGDLASLIADEVTALAGPESPEIVKFSTTEECAEQIQILVSGEDTVLVKGSRAMQMERIVAELTGEQPLGHHE